MDHKTDIVTDSTLWQTRHCDRLDIETDSTLWQRSFCDRLDNEIPVTFWSPSHCDRDHASEKRELDHTFDLCDPVPYEFLILWILSLIYKAVSV